MRIRLKAGEWGTTLDDGEDLLPQFKTVLGNPHWVLIGKSIEQIVLDHGRVTVLIEDGVGSAQKKACGKSPCRCSNSG